MSWLFEGEILHRDSVGSLQTVRPGELNLMTAGRGISHSEESPAGVRPPLLHGVQLWVALPGDRLGDEPFFEHHGDLPVWSGPGGERVQVLVGSLSVGGVELRSTATVFTPLVGAQVDLPAGASVEVEVDPRFEHALLVDAGDASFEGVAVPVASLGYVEPGCSTVTVSAGDEPVRAVLIGGEPFAEEIVMWWNFVGRSHDEVAAARAWEDGRSASGRFPGTWVRWTGSRHPPCPGCGCGPAATAAPAGSPAAQHADHREDEEPHQHQQPEPHHGQGELAQHAGVTSGPRGR